MGEANGDEGGIVSAFEAGILILLFYIAVRISNKERPGVMGDRLLEIESTLRQSQSHLSEIEADIARLRRVIEDKLNPSLPGRPYDM